MLVFPTNCSPSVTFTMSAVGVLVVSAIVVVVVVMCAIIVVASLTTDVAKDSAAVLIIRFALVTGGVAMVSFTFSEEGSVDSVRT